MEHPHHEQDLIRRIDSIGQFSANGLRAPHKPLLLILAFTRAANGLQREIMFADVEERLRGLLEIAGNRRPRPEFPFFYLKNDNLWVLGQGENENILLPNEPTAAFLRREGIWGALILRDYEFLKRNPDCAERIINHVLIKNFPESIFQEIHDILADEASVLTIAQPLSLSYQPNKSRRPTSFRQDVLLAYHYRCALCGFGLCLTDKRIGVEAAHIRWHAMGGPGSVTNGLALCYQHHKLFDLGIFTIDRDLRIEVSRLAHSWSHESQQIRTGTSLTQTPSDQSLRPAESYLQWHRDNVFKV